MHHINMPESRTTDADSTPPQQLSHGDQLLSIIEASFHISRGSPLPFGASALRSGINFSVFSRHANRVTLVLFCPGNCEPVLELPLDPRRHRTGDIWHVLVEGLDPRVEYGYRMWREPNSKPYIYRFDPANVLLDPWARKVMGAGPWGSGMGVRRSADGAEHFEWEYDQPLNTPLADSVIYELHVRGFTMHPTAMTHRPGTFAGLVEKIPYLKQLGVTAVELLPVHEFDECDNLRLHPETGEPLRNFWGYQPISFFAPNSGYADPQRNLDPALEFRKMVKRFHEAGIEVILDVVFNHTAEGDQRGPAQSFRGIDNPVYYLIDHNTGAYLNFSGTGNTLNCNHPVVREMIVSCLRYWVMEMHVDGFRFDLASILGRGQDGSVLASPPLLESLAYDPVLGQTKLIAEAWDAGGLYQVGSFPAWSRWAEWNGKFRDDIRRFVRGDAGMVPALATRLCGSPDLYQTSNREPYHSINFITCHDGFTLADLVSYNHKHNEANGEDNRDGENENLSWNCGHEGPSDDPELLALRRRQTRNFLTLLLVSQGVPMLLAGDEFGRTQGGNNNAYCQDNDISWVNWDDAERNHDLVAFVRKLIAFRKERRILRRLVFDETDTRIVWHGTRLLQPDWSPESRSLAMQITGPNETGSEDHIYLMANAWWKDLTFELPPLTDWRVIADTSLDGHQFPEHPDGERYHVKARSVVLLAS